MRCYFCHEITNTYCKEGVEFTCDICEKDDKMKDLCARKIQTWWINKLLNPQTELGKRWINKLFVDFSGGLG